MLCVHVYVACIFVYMCVHVFVCGSHSIEHFIHQYIPQCGDHWETAISWLMLTATRLDSMS